MLNCSKCNLIGPTVNLKRIRPIYCLFFHDYNPPPVFFGHIIPCTHTHTHTHTHTYTHTQTHTHTHTRLGNDLNLTLNLCFSMFIRLLENINTSTHIVHVTRVFISYPSAMEQHQL